jgi:hypothetical protein
MHQGHRAERSAARKRVVQLVVVHHQRTFVGHEMFEGVDAIGVHHRSHLVEDLLRPRRHRHVERIIAGRLLALVAPVLIGLEHGFAGRRNAKVDDHCGAAGDRRFRAPLEIVGGDRAHEEQLHMSVRINAAGQNVAAACVDGLAA